MLAVERLAGDFGSARFVWRRTEDGTAAAFAAEQAGGERPASIIFVGAGRAASTPQVDDDLISLIVEEEGERQAPGQTPRDLARTTRAL